MLLGSKQLRLNVGPRPPGHRPAFRLAGHHVRCSPPLFRSDVIRGPQTVRILGDNRYRPVPRDRPFAAWFRRHGSNDGSNAPQTATNEQTGWRCKTPGRATITELSRTSSNTGEPQSGTGGIRRSVGRWSRHTWPEHSLDSVSGLNREQREVRRGPPLPPLVGAATLWLTLPRAGTCLLTRAYTAT